MKTLLIVILSLFSTLIAFGQDYPDSGFTNKAEAKNLRVHGIKEGKWVYYFTSRSVKDEFDSNSVDYREYFLIVYKSGKRYGIGRKYTRSGKLLHLIPYINDKVNGMVKSYDTLTGNVFIESPYINDKENGLEKIYMNNGKVSYQTTKYHNDKAGKTKYYDENGNEIK
jgi:antitoxin component YwqK of YwqJK toxin-antitoxin module